MADVGSHHFVKGGSQVLVPQPSADPHDPLNWSPKWKALCIAASTSVSFTQGFGPLALAPMFPYYIKDFDSTLPDVSRLMVDPRDTLLVTTECQQVAAVSLNLLSK
ncbi:hypothetical protein LTR17_010466 [Elasticomyces elasticus]|nr:hypothetical protein LTR17_010466 [Elasticomyces elasticus]